MPGLIILCTAYVLSQFYRAFLAVLAPALPQELGATSSDLSLASGLWFGAFAAMQFVVGVCLDRYGPRRTSAWILGIAGTAGVICFAMAQSPLMIIVAMTLIGIGCSPVLMASLYIFARSFEPKRFAFLVSLFVAIGTIGNVAAATPLAAASEVFGWRAVVYGLAGVTLLVAVLIFAIVGDPLRDDGDESDNCGLAGYWELLRIPALWLIFPIMVVNYSVAAGVRGLWAGLYLADIHGADALLIGQVTLWMAVAMAIGSFAYGPLDTFFNTRKWVVIGGLSLTIASLIPLALYPDLPLAVVNVLLIVMGATGLAYGVIMAHAKAWFPVRLTGRGVTLMNFFSIAGVSLMQVSTGRVVAMNAADGAEASYSALFAFYAIAVAVPLAIYLFSKDAKPSE